MGVVLESEISYNIQERFHMKGMFSIKLTPLGENLCLLEEAEEGEIMVLVEEVSSWIEQWSIEVKEWTP